MPPHESPGTSPGELPIHLTRFVGRDRELGNLIPLLESVRLLTLTGAGGSGKTRLARELAAVVARHFTRVAWTDLAPLNEGGLLADHVAAALHVPERADSSAHRAVLDAIGDERVLLVLDNCEHLVDACANLVDAMLRACPNLTVLATSREALGVASETAWLVPPMVSAEATQLFADRASAILPAFTIDDANGAAINEICRRLDGIPLAIELAAARVRVLSPEQIASRLDDAFRLLSSGSRTALPRHRTLRATMEWSYALLGAREQVLLRRLSVFPGTFTLDAAEAACAGDPLEVEDILDGVAALVDKSLVVMEAGDGVARYRLLETVRQYACERLDEAGETWATEKKHAEHYLSVMERAAPNLVGGSNTPGLVDALMREQDNIRAAAIWSMRRNADAEIGLRFAGSLFWLCYAVGQFRENRALVDRGLMRETDRPVLRGRVLLSSGLTALAQGDYPLSEAHLTEAVEILRAEQDHVNLGTAMAKLGAAKLLGGDFAGACAILDQVIAAAPDVRRLDMGVVFARFWRGWAAYGAGEYDRAHELFLPNVMLGREFNQPTTIAHTLVALARVEIARGDIEEACSLVTEALEMEVAIGDAWGVALALDVVALAAEQRDRHDDATRLVAGTEAHRERLAMALPGPAPLEREQLVERLKTSLGAQYEGVYAEGRALATPELVRLALVEAARHTSEHRISITAEMAIPKIEARKKLRVAALGPLQVFVGGEQIESTAWGSARPRELLVYLLMHPEGRTKEQVGLAFWPEASASQLRNSFHVTLHRLRRALGGPEWICLGNDRYRVDPELLEDFDVASFEQDVAHARRALKRREDGACARLEQALARFRGDLLDGEPVGDWHLEHRDRFQRVYVDALMELGARLLEEDRPLKAVDAYRRVLTRDPLHEDAALALMRCHAAAGERAQALKVFRRLSDRLREELDAEPGTEVLLLSEQLQQGNS